MAKSYCRDLEFMHQKLPTFWPAVGAYPIAGKWNNSCITNHWTKTDAIRHPGPASCTLFRGLSNPGYSVNLCCTYYHFLWVLDAYQYRPIGIITAEVNLLVNTVSLRVHFVSPSQSLVNCWFSLIEYLFEDTDNAYTFYLLWGSR